MKKVLYILLIVQSLIFGLSISPQEATPALKKGINQYLKGNFKASVGEIYRANGYKLMWAGDINAQRLNDLSAAFNDITFNYNYKNFGEDAVLNLTAEIDSGAYQGAELTKLMARLDIAATQAYIKLIYYIRKGDVDWGMVKRKLKNLKADQDIHAVWEINPRKMPSAASIIKSIKSNNINGYLRSLLPLKEQYLSLISILEQYRNMPNSETVPYGVTIHPGMQDNRVVVIKKILQSTGDYSSAEEINNVYSGDLSQAVSAFRGRFNLQQGDYIDNKLIKYINTGRGEYVQRIITNLEMLKIYPSHYEPNHIEVNIPEFMLRYYKGGNSSLESEVIVGRIDRPTPVFSNNIKFLVLNPTWTITDNLVKKDLIHVLRDNPNYLKEHNIHVFTSYKKDAKEVPLDFKKLAKYEHSKKAVPYRFVQFPGDSNALGRVKFMFPNKYDVYLHDTDNKSLFQYRYRVFSSGCMRIKYPFELMDNILKDAGSNYSPVRAHKIIDSGIKTTYTKLKKSVPIHIRYQTVREVNGQAQFFYDIYMYEQIVWESMAGQKLNTFVVPDQRLTAVKMRGSALSN